TVLAEGSDFFSAPRLAPDGSHLAWLRWNHPNLPWDGTELALADLDAGGRPGAGAGRPRRGGPAGQRAGRRRQPVRLDRPAALVAERRPPLRRRARRLGETVPGRASGTRTARAR